MKNPPVFRQIELSDPRFESEGLRTMTVNSPALGRRGDLTLYIPSQPEPSNAWPLVVLLHGVYGSHWSWALKGGAHRTAARMIGSGEIPEMVLAMPSDGLWCEGSGYVPHADADYERWIIEEVPGASRLATDRVSEHSPLFLAGLSMGGFGALRMGAKYRRLCAGMSGHSSVTRVDDLDRFIGCSRQAWSHRPEDESVIGAVAGGTGPLPPFRFDCGMSDPLLEANRELHRDLNARGVVHEYFEYPGGHEWAYWERYFADTLRFFAAVVRLAEPVPASG